MAPPPPAPMHVPGLDDLAAQYLGDQRKRPDGSPWVLMNMVTSVDGAISIAGRSGGLGGPADHRIFRILRSLADVILVGAQTVRTEGYGPPQLGHELQQLRKERGQAALPRIAVVTRSVDLDPDLRLFGDPDLRPMVITSTDADPQAVDRVAPVADVVAAGAGSVDLKLALQEIAATGAQVVLSEGGPTLNGQLLAADVIDEVDWTISPLMVGGTSRRMATGPEIDPRAYRLDRAVPVGDMLFCRYLHK